jgi:hypothetical protein
MKGIMRKPAGTDTRVADPVLLRTPSWTESLGPQHLLDLSPKPVMQSQAQLFSEHRDFSRYGRAIIGVSYHQINSGCDHSSAFVSSVPEPYATTRSRE